MGWEGRKRGPRTGYYYRSVRTEDGVRKIYFGRRTAGHLAAAAVEMQRKERQRAKASIESERKATIEADRLATELQSWTKILTTAWLAISGLHCHRGCWRMKHE